jgi:hypothetical protein
MAAARWLFHVGTLIEPPVGGGEGQHLGLVEAFDGGELEGRQGLAAGQAGLGQVAGDPSLVAIGDFVFAQGCQEAGGAPAFVVGLLGDLLP